MKIHPEKIMIDGVPVALYHMSSIEIAVVNIDFKAGSFYESPDNWGAVHYMEHMVHEGTKLFPNRREFEIYKETHAISQNASTSGQVLTFEAHFPTVSFKEGMNLLTQVVGNPTFPENEMQKEKNVVIQEYHDRWSQPNSRFWKAKTQYFYGQNHMVTRHPLGFPEYLLSLTRQQLVDTYEQSVNKKTMSITVVGNFRRASVEKLLRDLIKSTPESKERVLVPEKPHPQGSYLWHKEDMDKATIEITNFLPARSQLTLRERIILRIGTYILGGSPRSRIFQKLRGEHGLAYSAGAGLNFGLCASELYLVASTSIQNAKTAHDLLLIELEKILNNEITLEEFERARNYINLSTLTSYDSPYRINESLSSQLFWDKKLTSPQELIECANTIKKGEIASIYKKYLGKPIVAVMSKEDPQILS